MMEITIYVTLFSFKIHKLLSFAQEKNVWECAFLGEMALKELPQNFTLKKREKKRNLMTF